MSFPVKFTLSIMLFIALIVVGFMYLMRGCLSKYDERSIDHRVLYFDNGQQKIIFTMVKFNKTTSYSRNGGFISKSVSTTYSIQNNDAVNGNRIAEKEVKHHREIKNYPVEILGAAGNHAWVFINELMAFDPFTLTMTADLDTLEDKNPSLKGKFPEERKFYRFDNSDHQIYFTARDGLSWKIDGTTFLATPHEPTQAGTAGRVKQLEKLLKAIDQEQDSLLEHKLRRPSRQLSAKEIDMKTYQLMMATFSAERKMLYQRRDSLYKVKAHAESNQRTEDELQRRIISLQDNVHFSQLKVNADTAHGEWFGLYSAAEMTDLYDRFSYQSAYGEPARRQWYKSTYSLSKYGETIVAKDQAVSATSPDYFLNGGLLLNKNTAKPIRLEDSSFLVIYRTQVGNEGKILLAKISPDGTLKWTLNTMLNEWADYVFTGKQLFVTGDDNKELSGDDCNILWLINLKDGQTEKYDFFTQEKITNRQTNL